MKKLMTIEEAISTLSSSTQVRFVDKQGGDGYIAGNYNCKKSVSVKWLRKNHDDKYQKYSFGYIWNNYKVTDITIDEYGIVTLHLNCGLTKKQEVAKDRKFRKEHNGMSETEVNHREASRWLANIALLPMMLAGCSAPEDEYSQWYEPTLPRNRKSRRK